MQTRIIQFDGWDCQADVRVDMGAADRNGYSQVYVSELCTGRLWAVGTWDGQQFDAMDALELSPSLMRDVEDACSDLDALFGRDEVAA
jgi:hypothetical protein